MIVLLLLAFGFVCAILATAGAALPRVHFGWLTLALLIAAFLFGHVPVH